MNDVMIKTAEWIMKSEYAIALTGAGMSTESGIPDFRGPDGLWTKNPEAEKQAYQSYFKFQKNPKAYWSERLTGVSPWGQWLKATPNPGHFALAELENMGMLKCVITQNIDNLHQKAKSRRVLDYHGNLSLLRCFSCNTRFQSVEYDLERLLVEDRLPPICRKCQGILKSDVVHFNEPIPEDIARESREEVARCDLMLICGTSATVYPFAMLPRIAKQKVDRIKTVIIEINAHPTPLTQEGISDIFIQGKTGVVLTEILDAVKEISRGTPKKYID